MKDLLDVSAEMKMHEQALGDLYQQVGQGVAVVSVILELGCNGAH
jgi:hypothetical protein